ncbi:MAG: alanine--tRNA ligase [Thermodesulfobacteriota bacterium]|nr:alanine--tRNA ligase [Thermodesulfobacteriota bacterium]
MKGSEVRTTFLKYFGDREHVIVPSSSLVPEDDPTLLFTNAGMVQFKEVFLGNDFRPYTKATSSQKCVRAGGKHNDLENVGITARHHTFFEMLGNFSFGDYFKEGAICFAWDFLVNALGIDSDKLWISVYKDDDEAFTLWKDKIGVPTFRIVRLGDKDNFWSMGDTGPCGPCSEIIFDQGPEVGCGRSECDLTCGCDRFLEIWNLVFMQYNRDEKGNLTPLPRPNIDTGMGLERVTAILQGVHSNYDTDLFLPLLKFISEMSGIVYGGSAASGGEEADTSMRVIADHARASAFLACDGVLPSNEGRGYVLRRIIRRASRHGKALGLKDSFLHKVAMVVVKEMGGVYPELKKYAEFIDKVITSEEERFLKTLDKGLSVLDEIIIDLKARGIKDIPGKDIFMLYDTFGFPVDITEDIAKENGFDIDKEGFEAQMENQREMARASSSFGNVSGEIEISSAVTGKATVSGSIGETKFVGYDTLEASGKVITIQSLVGNDEEGFLVGDLSEGREAIVITDITPFYGESGGQIGDIGIIEAKGVEAEVLDTTKTASGIIMHKVKVKKGTLKIDQDVRLVVDSNRRLSIMRHHSATHLLQKALRDVLGDHVHQSGSLVTDKRLRFDFTHFAQLSEEEMEKIETKVNRYVLEDLPINTEILSKEEALKMGAMALFSEKYGDEVRVVTMGDMVSVELCGGTHCRSTGEIGMVEIISESSISAGLRRIEAFAGMQSLQHFRGLTAVVSKMAGQLRCTPAELMDRIVAMQEKIKDQELKIKDLNLELATGSTGRSGEERFSTDGLNVVIKEIEAEDIAQMREVGDRIKQGIGQGVIFLASPARGKATFMIMVTKDLGKKIDAGRLMKGVCNAVDGRGGGKALFAQGGSPDISSIKKAIDAFKKEIKG